MLTVKADPLPLAKECICSFKPYMDDNSLKYLQTLLPHYFPKPEVTCISLDNDILSADIELRSGWIVDSIKFKAIVLPV